MHVGGKKIKIKICWSADVGGKKMKKWKIDKFSMKMAIFRGKKNRTGGLNPACRRKKIKKAEMATFFSCRTYFQLIGGLVIRRI